MKVGNLEISVSTRKGLKINYQKSFAVLPYFVINTFRRGALYCMIDFYFLFWGVSFQFYNTPRLD